MNPYQELFGSSKPESKTAKFEFVKEIGPDVWVVVRPGDPRGEQYLARPIASYHGLPGAGDADPEEQEGARNSAWIELLRRGKQASSVSRILNHENIISLVGRINTCPFTTTQQDDTHSAGSKSYLVWDFCDAANLSTVFKDHPVKDSSYYLPESLCWHVLLSLTRAVAFLHDGARIRFQEDRDSAPPEWLLTDDDWLPILHRAIEPANIYFQHPRGTETYGQCKLGNFRQAVVTNQTMSRLREGWDQHRDIGTSLTTYRGYEPFDEILKRYSQDPEEFPEACAPPPWSCSTLYLTHDDQNMRPYTLGTEMWSIGAVVFTMMTGHAPTRSCQYCHCSHIERCGEGGCLQKRAREKGCRCTYGGCHHMPAEDEDEDEGCTHGTSPWKRCPHGHYCSQKTVNVDTFLARAKYSEMLRGAVTKLLNHDLKDKRQHVPKRAVPLAHQFESGYKRWRDNTDEGDGHRDIADDMQQRREAARARAKKQAEGEVMGSE